MEVESKSRAPGIISVMTDFYLGASSSCFSSFVDSFGLSG